jgi:hypothetical protein
MNKIDVLMGWAAECAEWEAIKGELLEERDSITAYDVSIEQRKRMWARGQRPMTYEEILAELREGDASHATTRPDPAPPASGTNSDRHGEKDKEQA